MKWVQAVAIVVTLFAAAGTSAAQSAAPAPPSKWWQDDKFKSELSLTAEQSARIEEIFQASIPKLRTSKEGLDRLEGQLSHLISESGVTEAEVMRQVDVVEAARSEMSKCRTLMLFRMRQVLSPEQRLKLNELHRHWEAERKKSGERR